MVKFGRDFVYGIKQYKPTKMHNRKVVNAKAHQDGHALKRKPETKKVYFWYQDTNI